MINSFKLYIGNENNFLKLVENSLSTGIALP